MNEKAIPTVIGSVGAPMPGDVIEVRVKEGQKVKKKDTLAILSAKKMEMVIEAPVDGVVKRVPATPKMKVVAGDLLVEIV